MMVGLFVLSIVFSVVIRVLSHLVWKLCQKMARKDRCLIFFGKTLDGVVGKQLLIEKYRAIFDFDCFEIFPTRPIFGFIHERNINIFEYNQIVTVDCWVQNNDRELLNGLDIPLKVYEDCDFNLNSRGIRHVEFLSASDLVNNDGFDHRQQRQQSAVLNLIRENKYHFEINCYGSDMYLYCEQNMEDWIAKDKFSEMMDIEFEGDLYDTFKQQKATWNLELTKNVRAFDERIRSSCNSIAAGENNKPEIKYRTIKHCKSDLDILVFEDSKVSEDFENMSFVANLVARASKKDPQIGAVVSRQNNCVNFVLSLFTKDTNSTFRGLSKYLDVEVNGNGQFDYMWFENNDDFQNFLSD